MRLWREKPFYLRPPINLVFFIILTIFAVKKFRPAGRPALTGRSRCPSIPFTYRGKQSG